MANLAHPSVWHDNIETGVEIYSDSQYWYVKVKESGDVRFSYPKTVDVFVVGGGGAGAAGNGASGGGGGYAKTVRGITIDRNTKYHVEIGRGGVPSYSQDAGGGNGGDGGTTTFALGDTVLAKAEGGKGGVRLGDDQNSPGGAGGCGGGAGTYVKGQYGGDGGSNAGNGGRAGTTSGGLGQASLAENPENYPATTRAFGTGELYCGGGGGSSRNMPRGGLGGAGGGGKGGSRMNSVEYPPEDGQPNTGGGGGGQTWDGVGVGSAGGAGGSGVVIIRGDQLDLLPVWFNGVQLSDIFLNDIPVENMWFGDLKLF